MQVLLHADVGNRALPGYLRGSVESARVSANRKVPGLPVLAARGRLALLPFPIGETSVARDRRREPIVHTKTALAVLHRGPQRFHLPGSLPHAGSLAHLRQLYLL